MAPPASGSTLPTSPTARLYGHDGPVHTIAYSAGDARFILTGASDRLIRLYNPSKSTLEPPPKDAKAPGLVTTFKGHAYEVLDIAVASDNSRLASVGVDKQVLLWDVTNARVIRRFEGHIQRCNAVAWGPEDSVVISGSYDATVKIWDAKSNNSKPIMSLSDAKDSISCLAVQDTEIYTGCVDGRVRIYDIRMGQISTDVIGYSVTAITPTTRGDAYLASTLNSSLLFMDKSSGKSLQSLTHPSFSNTAYRLRSTLAANDALAVTGTEDGRILVWDILSGSLVHELWHNDKFQSHADGKRSVVSVVKECPSRDEWCSSGGDGIVVVWASRPV